MSEQFPGQPERPETPNVHELSAEELRGGYRLQPAETVALDIPSTPTMAQVEFEAGNGVKIAGKPVAEVRVGGDTVSVEGTVIETDVTGSMDSPDKHYAIVFSGAPDSQPFAMKLESGQSWGIGRGFQGQENLPTTVSGDHCAVGLDEQGRFTVENHNPTNHTSVRRIGI